MQFSEADTYGEVLNLVRSEINLVPGMRRLLEHCNSICPDTVWREIADLDFASDSDNLNQWLRALLKAEPPEENIVAFWFGVFDEAGTDGRGFTRLYLSGSETYDSGDKAGDWACSATYFPHGRYADSRVLRSVSDILRTAAEDASELGSYVCPLTYACLAVTEACHQIPHELLLGRHVSRALAVGFDSGDFITLAPIRRQLRPTDPKGLD
jgi:hypothetical protein